VSHHCAGCSTTAGMAGCPEHGGHSWSSSQVVVTHCQHGLDLRIHPRCYLCEPAATPAPLDEGRLARALFVICAACEPGEEYTDNHHRRHAEAIAAAYAEEAPDEGNEWQERNE